MARVERGGGRYRRFVDFLGSFWAYELLYPSASIAAHDGQDLTYISPPLSDNVFWHAEERIILATIEVPSRLAVPTTPSRLFDLFKTVLDLKSRSRIPRPTGSLSEKGAGDDCFVTACTLSFILESGLASRVTQRTTVSVGLRSPVPPFTLTPESSEAPPLHSLLTSAHIDLVAAYTVIVAARGHSRKSVSTTPNADWLSEYE
ncbi:hypothetical protein C8T65DRAFT_746215 [Cerioporus squamosus]|nr:hypothetical protein C8T65DRAFT_746215 [Cerioporus squamosus]